MRSILVSFASLALVATSLVGLAVAQDESPAVEPSATTDPAPPSAVEPTGSSAEEPTTVPPEATEFATDGPEPGPSIPLECREHQDEIRALAEGVRERLQAEESELRARVEAAKKEFLSQERSDADRAAFEQRWRLALGQLQEEKKALLAQAFDEAGFHACLKPLMDARPVASSPPKPPKAALDEDTRTIMEKCEGRIRAFVAESGLTLPPRLPANVRPMVSSDGADVGEGEGNGTVPERGAMPQAVPEAHAAIQAKLEQLRRACAEELRHHFQGREGAPDDELRKGDAYPAALAQGNIGAEVALKKGGKPETLPMRDGFQVRDVTVEPARFSANVDSDDGACKTVVFQIESGVLDGAADALQVKVTDLSVTDGATAMEVHMASDLDDVLDPCDDGAEIVEYWAVTDANGLQLLVSIPHFSEKRIEVASAEASSPSSFVPGLAAPAIVSVLAIAAMALGRRRP